jgi:peptidoglycan hydrolase CwlO-like protein
MSPFDRPHLRRCARRTRRPRAGLPLAVATIVVAVAVGPAGLVGPAGASGNLESRIAASQSHANELHAGIGADEHQIEGFQGSIDDLQGRLSALESSLTGERDQLLKLQSELHTARQQMGVLQNQLDADRKVLVAQVVASYEAPQPSIVSVVLESHGFADLIERVDDLTAIARENAQATVRVAAEQRAVTIQAAHLAELETRQQRNTTAVLVQRDEVAQLHLALLKHQQQYIQARDQKSSELSTLHAHQQGLEHELATLQARELAATGDSLAYTGPVGAPSLTTHGEYGFFPAAGTNYTVGEEPTIAARLNNLGTTLHLHLIGISGYRTPQHSIEVGGFANDPHTRGEASDTPGIEGVPEATLERFGLTRPFPGAAEADHIQLLGSPL